MKATVESHHSVTIYVSNFPALPGSPMEDNIDSFQVLLLALRAHTGIQKSTGLQTTFSSGNTYNTLFILQWRSQNTLN